MFIYKAAVVGGGTMGSGIAQVITYSGLPVVVKEVNAELAQRALSGVRRIYEGRVQKGRMTQGELEAKMALVTAATEYADLKDVDIVIEAVPEKMELKKQVFRDLDRCLPDHAILATNTSALSISELGAVTRRPDKVIGMHFFYPAQVMKLVEVIPGLSTSEETVADTISFGESLRKLPVRVQECAGFLVNRLLMPYLNEAAFCVEEGSANFREVDQAMAAFGFPMGPFTLVDTLGLDVCHDVVGILLEEYGNRMRPAGLWEEVYRKGRCGVKSGAGFYAYGAAPAADPAIDEILGRLRKERASTGKAPFSPERLLLAMVNEAAFCIQEKIVSPSDIDIALLAGIGFPQSKGGLLAYADAWGVDEVLKRLEELHGIYGDRFFPAPLIRRMVRAGFLGKKAGRGFLEYA
ncbi:MAG: 3-hydroxyacyl-CoA dehydrogenase [Candidatus Omnitrophica bacterium]|nr:3-hydroxyacyl-CoA dehydrogenase [Candidatus Omnitrophota bacterium]